MSKGFASTYRIVLLAAGILVCFAGLGARLPSDAVVDDNLAFAKERTISRLIEMQSLDYLMDHARLHARVLLPALEEARARAGRVAGRKN